MKVDLVLDFFFFFCFVSLRTRYGMGSVGAWVPCRVTDEV